MYPWAELLLFALMVWTIYLVITLVLTSPIFFLGSRRARWTWYDFGHLIVPYWMWAGLMAMDSSGKGFSNAAFELGGIGLAVAIAFSVRVATGQQIPPRVAAICLIGFPTAMAVVLWSMVPPMLD